MWEDILAKLTKLSKEQLIYIIEQYRRATLRNCAAPSESRRQWDT